jgi:N-succinyldiaminopimelate aminotransferase
MDIGLCNTSPREAQEQEKISEKSAFKKSPRGGAMSVSRLKHITPIGVEQMGELADSFRDPNVLRLENLDTDLRPPERALEFTKQTIDDDAANSYLPFFGLDVLREAAADLVGNQSSQQYDWKTECIVCAGGLSGILNVLMATVEPGDEVLMTDPIYVGLINRVRLAGGVPRFVPLIASAKGWRLDREALATIDPRPVKAALMMSPSMPTGAVFDRDDWQTLIEFCESANCWLIYDAAMERILYDGRTCLHPASFRGMRDRVITVGSASKEYRMIGWRVGWVVGPADIVADVARVSITNVVCQSGIAMGAVATAIRDPNDGIQSSVEEWQRRRDVLLDELRDFVVIPPHGGWSLLMDVSPLGLDGATTSKLLLELGKIAATPMLHWGSERSNKYVRFVFANEPVHRLRGLGARFKEALNSP